MEKSVPGSSLAEDERLRSLLGGLPDTLSNPSHEVVLYATSALGLLGSIVSVDILIVTVRDHAWNAPYAYQHQ